MNGSVSEALDDLSELYAERALDWVDQHPDLAIKLHRTDRQILVLAAETFGQMAAEDCEKDGRAAGIRLYHAHIDVVRGGVILAMLR